VTSDAVPAETVDIHGHGRWPGRGLRRPSPGHGERAPRGAEVTVERASDH